MTDLLTKVWTYEDYLTLPDDGNRYEIIRGDLIMTPAPGMAPQYSSSRLHRVIANFVIDNNLGEVYHAPYDVRLSKNADPIEPDILFVAKERVPEATDSYLEGVPDLVIEILSKRTARMDTSVKFSLYEEAGVPEYWIVDPKTESVRVYTLEDGLYEEWGAFSKGDVITSKVLAGLEIVNSTLFKR